MVIRHEGSWPNLPQPVSNNSVTSQDHGGRTLIFSFLGIGSSKTYDTITNAGYVLDGSVRTWSALFPGSQPWPFGLYCAERRPAYFLFGGYTVDGHGKEHSLPNLDIYSTASGTSARGSDMPVPVDDSVSGVYRDRYIYLISGWSETDNVSRVQMYDTVTDAWRRATDPGPASLRSRRLNLGDRIIYCDGVYRTPHGFAASDECWRAELMRLTLL